MNHKERFITALEIEEPDYVPITDLGIDPPIVKEILKKDTGMRYHSLSRENNRKIYSSHSLSGKSNAWKAALDYRIEMIEACMKLDFDAVIALSDKFTTKKYKPKYLDEKKFIDQWGRLMQTSPESKTTYWVGGTVNTDEDLEKFEPPTAFHPDVIEMMERILKPIKDKDIIKIGHCHSGWTLAWEVRGGIDKMIIDLYKNPRFAKKIIEKTSNACRRFAEAMLESGADVLWISDDYADNHGPLINPNLLKEYELPNLKKIVNIGKKYHVPVIFHSDGNLNPIIEYLINTGINGLHPIEPGAMDLRDIKKKYGHKVCLLGNVDCRYILPYGGEEDVRNDVRRCIDAAAKGGGFILTSSNSIHANVKVENVYTMINEARKYGKYPLKR